MKPFVCATYATNALINHFKLMLLIHQHIQNLTVETMNRIYCCSLDDIEKRISLNFSELKFFFIFGCHKIRNKYSQKYNLI